LCPAASVDKAVTTSVDTGTAAPRASIADLLPRFVQLLALGPALTVRQAVGQHEGVGHTAADDQPTRILGPRKSAMMATSRPTRWLPRAPVWPGRCVLRRAVTEIQPHAIDTLRGSSVRAGAARWKRAQGDNNFGTAAPHLHDVDCNLLIRPFKVATIFVI